jgi:predicted nucleic-acid-binding Zn-ribbon protein
MYDYSKVIYINSQTKVIITCKIHGDFDQIPNSHLQGCGCNECGKIIRKEKRTSTLDEFISKSNEIHNNMYDYSKVIYINSKTQVIITCKIHGDFEQIPTSHLRGCGCNKCGKITSKDKQLFTLDDFISNANKIHNNMYDYSKVNYTGANNHVIIICKKHNEFNQKPSKHINARQGCPKCAFTNYSKQQISWLNFISNFFNINIQHAENGGECLLGNIKADGYCKENNTVYEYYGDFWHGNPKIYNQNSINKKNNKTFGELYQNTLKREKQIVDIGFNLMKIWESDWIKINKSIKILQRKFKNHLILKYN